jgi:hypothetical protein
MIRVLEPDTEGRMTPDKEGMALVRELRDLADRVNAYISGKPESADDRWARKMLTVLAEVERRGGRVRQEEFLEIGVAIGYGRNGMGGFHQKLVVFDEDGWVTLTPEGVARLAILRKKYREL